MKIIDTYKNLIVRDLPIASTALPPKVSATGINKIKNVPIGVLNSKNPNTR
jgi:hypothetical protein